MTSFTNETAPTPEKAMELGKEIFKPITDTHLSVIGTHFKEREKCSYHDHVVVSPTNFLDGTMLYGDNTTNFALAQRMADITGQPTQLVVRKENETEWKCSTIFVPQNDTE